MICELNLTIKNKSKLSFYPCVPVLKFYGLIISILCLRHLQPLTHSLLDLGRPFNTWQYFTARISLGSALLFLLVKVSLDFLSVAIFDIPFCNLLYIFLPIRRTIAPKKNNDNRPDILI